MSPGRILKVQWLLCAPLDLTPKNHMF